MRLFVSTAEMGYEKIKETIQKYENVELRLDLLELSDKQYEDILSKHKSLIVTCRKTQENKDKRVGYLLKAVENDVDYIDIDIMSKKNIIKNMKKNMKKSNTQLIISFHDYNNTPKDMYLKKIIKKALNMGADFVKIATNIKSNSDMIRLLNLARNNNVIPVGMGDRGKISRIINSLADVPIVYTSIENKTTAEGQINYEILKDILERIKKIE
ncbi:MAG: type I 3-dehydroquinate dehydratase [Candidatus Mcinerneyibacterium aminivorans]|jgi:3-dehydroquinate dehydratase-1|uniref:3-dehydroquinate dehydratase n=1 Tax=Candidatus Mcinerneyibacterium aminivorans TaxID=2703815 RepID=A0A5D0MEV0_9BACT|nr:MAG: type I 3-dehydroquinate dehydratase [Candidatus Mcinerneyibacterium aminivorans]